MNGPGGSATEAVHAYLAAFLPPATVEALVAEQPDPEDRVSALATAREALRARVEVAEEVELAVLVEEVELDVDELSRLLALPPDDVRARLRVAGVDPGDGADAADGDGEQPEPRGPVRAGPRRLGVVPVALFVVAAALGVVAVTGTGGDGGDGDDADAAAPVCAGPDGQVCITDARLVSDIDLASGTPVTEEGRRRFRLGESVRLWFAYDRPPTGVRARIVWYRDGETLSATSFVIHEGPHASLTLPEQRGDRPGVYRVELLVDDEVVVERRFRITADGGSG